MSPARSCRSSSCSRQAAGLPCYSGCSPGGRRCCWPASVRSPHFCSTFIQATRRQMISFMKNITIAGGFLVLAGAGPGALALDNRR